jgi:ribosomal protein L11 methyltransferase
VTPSADADGRGLWLELAVEADIEAVDTVSEILGRVAPGGVSVEPAFELIDEGLAARVDPSRPAVVRAYVPARDPLAAEESAARADAALGRIRAFNLRPIGGMATRLVHEADWADAWKAHFPVLHVGRRLVIRPSWRRYRARSDELVIALDPGMAFGTGLHPTTRLCLVALERLGAPSQRVLDLGCGSGILSLAAVRLGGRTVVALDTDPIAIEATETNARRNRAQDQIHARLGSLPSGEPRFDLVVANLVGSILVELSPALAGELRGGGQLVASGIFRDREPEVRGAFADAGLLVRERDVEGDWVALTATAGGS